MLSPLSLEEEGKSGQRSETERARQGTPPGMKSVMIAPPHMF